MTHGSYFHVSWRDIEGNADLTLRLGRTKLQHIPVSWDSNKTPVHHRVDQVLTSYRRSRLCSFQKLLPENLDLLFLTFLKHFIPIWLYIIWVNTVITSSFFNTPLPCINYWGITGLGLSSTQRTDLSWSMQGFNYGNAFSISSIRFWYKFSRLNMRRISLFPFQRKTVKIR